MLNRMELQVAKVKEEAFSRKDILERVEKWMTACKEEASTCRWCFWGHIWTRWVLCCVCLEAYKSCWK
ncbi:hypothetical protein C5167_002720 [Papaver somniferum]|uniref:Uncharacterized protein n=1 Tax=Papaver somniferum TaxID=3469 RepID=A0A4Y7L1N3_PAPSO|nr:hypothetical protein C5167_002720 [Papaver somniferum]